MNQKYRDILIAASAAYPTKGPHAAHGERFRSVRLSLGLTLRRTAELTGMSMTQVSMIERGEIMPSTLDVWPLLEFATGKLESYQKVKP